MSAPPSRAAGIVLAGGRSSRMGSPKASLPWDGASLAARVCLALAPVTDRVVLVRAPGQELPPLPGEVLVVEDRVPGGGPLEGLLAGLRAMGDACDRAVVAAVDLPWLTSALAARLLAALGESDADAAVPRSGGRPQPLLAAYRATVADEVQALVGSGERRAVALPDRLRVRWLDEDDLLADPRVREDDPALRGLHDVDTPADLIRARVWRVTA